MTMRSLVFFGGAVAGLWIVPSIGTQGMGTINTRVAHADAPLFDTVPDQRAAARAVVARADADVESAIGL